MKELTIEQKAEAYDEALKAAVVAHKDEDRHLKATLERIFPELKESEDERKDERIRKVLIDYFNRYKEHEECGVKTFYGIPTDAILAWLEKQGEQKLTNSYCQEHCKGFQETGKCFADGDCKAKTIAETVHAGTENILNELADRIEKAEIVNTKQVLEWIDKQTKE